jgi:hypothetical protein
MIFKAGPMLSVMLGDVCKPRTTEFIKTTNRIKLENSLDKMKLFIILTREKNVGCSLPTRPVQPLFLFGIS